MEHLVKLRVGLGPTKDCSHSFADCVLCHSDSPQQIDYCGNLFKWRRILHHSNLKWLTRLELVLLIWQTSTLTDCVIATFIHTSDRS